MTRIKMRALVALFVVLGVVVTVQVLRPAVPIRLESRGARVYSQSNEDGIIAAIFEIIQPTSRFAIEFGCSDGLVNSNVRNLIVHKGWGGLLMDGEEKLIEIARKNFAGFPKAKIVPAWVYPGNVEILFEQHGVPPDLDLLVIDIDSNDYYVWRAIHDFRPKLVVIEYNRNFPPPLKRVVHFHPLNYWDHSDYWGASMQSLFELGKKKGYELVFANEINMFFVDGKYYSRFGIKDNRPVTLYADEINLSGANRNHYSRFGNLDGKPDGKGDDKGDKKNGKTFADELTWEHLKIPKKWVELP